MPLPDVYRLHRSPGTALTAHFRAIGLTREYVREMTEPGEDDLRNPLTATRSARFRGEPADIALRLFFCREPISASDAELALGRNRRDALLDCGLLVQSGADTLVCPFHLRTVLGLYVFGDYLNAEADAVMGGGETTAILYRAGRPTRPVRRALDLGCGAGTLALLLARDAEQVIGTDINPRAVALAAFNASVNGIPNVSFRAGDVYGPVAGETFDLILSQPPYYPNPSGANPAAKQVLLHGGERGDELSRRVVSGAPVHLDPQGRAVVFTSWPEMREQVSSDGLRVLELRTNRLELHGMRQSICVIEHAEPGEGWSAQFDVAADRWGSVSSPRIDQMIATEELLRKPAEELLGACLRLPAGAAMLSEDSKLFLRGSAESLVGFVPIEEEMWVVISEVNCARDVRSAIEKLPSGGNALAMVVRALRTGILTIADQP